MFGHDTRAQEIYANELSTLHKVADHVHLVKIRGTYTDKKHLVMLLDPVADENLKDYMNRGPLHSVEDRKVFRTYFGCLADTIRFLHDPSIEILHKDIKPENILLKNRRLYLTDFGTAFDWSKTGQSMTQSNAKDFRTPRYQSPEAASGQFHRSSDIWSLGVVFLEMVTILRGRELADMDKFLQSHGQNVVYIHNNLEAAMNWFEQLQQGYQEGSAIDNEPLTWIKSMLNRVGSNRPTASDLFDMIVDFQDAGFCGTCCSGEDSDSSGGSEEGTDMLSYIPGSDTPTETVSGSSQKVRTNIPGDWPVEDEICDSQAQSVDQKTFDPPTEVEPLPPASTEAGASVRDGRDILTETRHLLRQSYERPGSVAAAAEATLTEITYSSPALKISSTASRKGLVKPKSRNFQERDSFIRWLATVPSKFAPTPAQHKTKLAKHRPSQPSRAPSMETQRIKHFLSSLPEEAVDFEEAPEEYDDLVETVPLLKASKRSRTMPVSLSKNITIVTRSNSQEDLQSSSHQLHEDTDMDQFADINRAKPIHYASDSNLNLALVVSAEALCEVKKDLVEFAASNSQLSKRRNQMLQSCTSECQRPAAGSVTIDTAVNDAQDLLSSHGQPIDSDAAQSLNDHRIQGPTTVAEETKPPSETATHLPDRALLARDKGLPKASKNSKAPRLRAFVKNARPRRPQWESATVIMGRILDDKVSEAPTSVMSLNTRAKVSGGRPVLRWNDRYYGYLQYFVADGKVGAVREMLEAGCNPGTEQKPRWAPVYNAIRGASDKHLKCLRALTEHGANVNAVRSTNGRTFLHYAIEQSLWPGYSSVVYTLLANGADPNIRDNANDLPLLMLLVGNGQLPQEKRDALFLLLAPNFKTNLDVSVPGTLDNPLHLAVRRKDAYTVDAILTKIQEVRKGGLHLNLISKRNASGFTPLLLAFTIFTMKQASDEELRIIDLLLDNGASPDDQDATEGKTPLHLVIGISKNSIALELLCRRSANPRIRDSSGHTATDLVHLLQLQHPNDKWYVFAEKRMLNALQDEDWQAPELASFFFEE